MLHGFGQTHRAWDAVRAGLPPERYRALAPDLPGHGACAQQRPLAFAAVAERLLELAPERFRLAGYSLGGRLALHVALAAPARISGLILVSTTAGLPEAEDRAARRAADDDLAHGLETGDYEAFIARWRGQPLFADDPPDVRELAVADMRRNEPRELAAVLRGLGTGRMEPLWPRLGELRMPAVALAGERDERYARIAARLASVLPAGRAETVPGGHSLLLENPGAVARAILSCGPPR